MNTLKDEKRYKPKILVVEDEVIILKDTMHKLKQIGYEAEMGLNSGKDLLKVVEKSRPDLVIMDIQLQEEIDGIELAEKIVKELATPVIFLTAYSDKKTFERAVVTNPDNYLVKPIGEQELKAAIEKSLFRGVND